VWRQGPAFWIVTALLLVAALGLNITVRFLELHFRKLPVDLRQSLNGLPKTLGPWVLVPNDEGLPPDMIEALGTKEYAFLDYVDGRLVSAKELEELQSKAGRERREQLARLQQRRPAAVVNLGLTYYTGKADTVAHIPDRCYIAGGFEPISYKIEKWPIGRQLSLAGGEGIEVRYINFEDQSSGRNRLRRNVCYFFHANGQFESDPLGVRRRLQSLRERYGYYLKIETMSLEPDADKAARVMQDFLSQTLPAVQACLPDWNRLRQSGVPTGK
jgi:hypothetical protein